MEDNQREFSCLDKNTASTSLFVRLCQHLGVEFNAGWPDEFGLKLKYLREKKVTRSIKTLSLFTGAGGLDIGFHDVGFEIYDMVDIEEKFISTLRYNTGKDKYFKIANPICKDIRDYHPDRNIKIDFIIGGPPCQTFSAAGRRVAGVQGISEDRGTLFEEYVRILKILQPKGFLYENVYGITGAEGGLAFKKIQEKFKEAGYKLFNRILDTADYGVPQFRERMFLVGIKRGEYEFPRPTHGPDSLGQIPYYYARKACEKLENSDVGDYSKIIGRYGHLLDEIPPGLNYSYFTKKMGHPNPIFAWRSKFSDFLYKADPVKPVRTIKANGGQYTGPFHWDNRTFSIRELKRLQTFPDNYYLDGSHQNVIRQIGNSVPPQIVRILAISILQQIYGVSLPVNLPTLCSNDTLGFRKRKRDQTKHYQQIAQVNIQKLHGGKRKKIKIIPKQYFARVDLDFTFSLSTNRRLDCLIDFRPNRHNWVIHSTNNLRKQKTVFNIEIIPNLNDPWDVKLEKVLLTGTDLNKNAFLCAWKAFEYELISSGLKADLVQLSGYFQYTPKFCSKMSIKIDSSITYKWNAIMNVVSGLGVRKIYSHDDLANELRISPKKLLSALLYLKELGFEVRSHKTNPKIKKGFYLIPYTFPTLSPLSVQLKKKLV